MPMGNSKINYRNDLVTRYYSWNPGGFGCAEGCDGCWAAKMAKGPYVKCPDCRAFRVHVHPERLDQPAETKRPGLVLVNFTNDMFAVSRPAEDVGAMLEAMGRAHQHKYIMLTKQPQIARYMLGRYVFSEPGFGVKFNTPNWFLGLSVCNAGQVKKIGKFLSIGKTEQYDAKIPKFLSIEPCWSNVNIRPVDLKQMAGVIVGHDNRPKASGTDQLKNIRFVVEQCAEAGTPCFVKQIWRRPGQPGWPQKNQIELITDPERMPEDLQVRNLPWSTPADDETRPTKKADVQTRMDF